LAANRYEAMGLRFAAMFGFDAGGRLNRVTLALENPAAGCDTLQQAAVDIYGQPEQVDRDPRDYVMRWRDLRESQLVTFNRRGRGLLYPEVCTVTYEPAPTGL
jgi:hypothetical protein